MIQLPWENGCAGCTSIPMRPTPWAPRGVGAYSISSPGRRSFGDASRSTNHARIMNDLIRNARWFAELLGRDSGVVRLFRPWYGTVLDLTSGRHGIPWMINGVTYRVVPRHRYQMASTYDVAPPPRGAERRAR